MLFCLSLYQSKVLLAKILVRPVLDVLAWIRLRLWILVQLTEVVGSVLVLFKQIVDG